MKNRMNIKSLVIISAVWIVSLLFINMSFATNTGKISVDTANLRETADENARILELLSMSQEVEVIEKTGDWYKVKANGMTGYLRQDLITVNEKVEENNTNNETVVTRITESYGVTRNNRSNGTESRSYTNRRNGVKRRKRGKTWKAKSSNRYQIEDCASD